MVEVELPNTHEVGEQTAKGTLKDSYAECTVKVTSDWITIVDVDPPPPTNTVDYYIYKEKYQRQYKMAYVTRRIVKPGFDWVLQTSPVPAGSLNVECSFSVTRETSGTLGVTIYKVLTLGVSYSVSKTTQHTVKLAVPKDESYIYRVGVKQGKFTNLFMVIYIRLCASSS